MTNKYGGMPPVSDFSCRAEWEKACWRKISTSQNLLNTFITAYERHNLVMRAAISDRLLAGKSYHQISNELWISPQTISGIKKTFKEKRYRSYLERSRTERKKKIYHSFRRPTPSRPQGRPVRTKYGIVYIP